MFCKSIQTRHHAQLFSTSQVSFPKKNLVSESCETTGGDEGCGTTGGGEDYTTPGVEGGGD
jgi:hypothetical protein